MTHRAAKSAFAVAGVSLCASHLASQTPASAAQSMPPAVYSVGAAYDAGRGRLVVFGGYMNGVYNGDTWEWDGNAWHQVTTQGPSARNGPALAYDAAHHQVVLFGGDTHATGALGDTWMYDGTSWKEIKTPGPPARSTHEMVYDARRQRVVLFGGSSGERMLGDTWEWDGEHWKLVASDGPAARALHGLAYDAARGRVVLFGGTSVLAPNAPSFGDTWEWDGVRWGQATATGPSARDHLSLGYDAIRRLTILHGGGVDDADAGETWGYDGTTWTRLSSSGPRRRYAKLVYDAQSKAMVLYGGFDRVPSNELWRFDSAGWRRLDPH